MSDGFYRSGEWELGKIIDGRRDRSDRPARDDRNRAPRNDDKPKTDVEESEKDKQ